MNFRTGLIVIITCLLTLFFIVQCRETVIPVLGGYLKENVSIKTDTIYLPVKIDTLEVFHSYITTRGIILDPLPVVKYIIKTVDNTPIIIDSTKAFEVVIKDSLIDGKISIINDFTGNLLTSDFTYMPLFPKIIEKRIPYKVTETKTITLDNPRTYYGIGLGGNSLGYPSVHGSILTKKKMNYTLEYEVKSILNTPDINKGIIGVKITKFF